MRWLKFLFKLFLGIILFSLLQVGVLKFVPVYVTPLMLIRCVEQLIDGKPLKMEHRWVSLEKISPHLPQAVVASEDNLFLSHSGFDFNQIQKAMNEADRGGRKRGASTISQQTAKNVFLWPSHSWIRKGLEAYYTLLIECVWGKRRIMEVYLNSIEMGPGVYGAQSAALLYFKTTAAKLSAQQSATIAATLPNPLRMNSAKPSGYVSKRSRQILELMRKIDQVDLVER